MQATLYPCTLLESYNWEAPLPPAPQNGDTEKLHEVMRAIPTATIEAIQAIASTLKRPTVQHLSKKKLSHSVYLVKASEVTKVFISLDQALPDDGGMEGFKHTYALYLQLDAKGHFESNAGVVEVVKKSGKLTKVVERRLSIMQDLAGHPQIPRDFVFIQKQGKSHPKVVIFQEKALCDLIDYHHKIQHLDKIPYENKLILFEELLTGLLAIHKKGYLHKDIKPDNILVFYIGNTLHVKITDFGFACKATDAASREMCCGTFSWISPELFYRSLGPNAKTPLGQELDIWALGLVFETFLRENPSPLHSCLIRLQRLWHDLKLRTGNQFLIRSEIDLLQTSCKDLIDQLPARPSAINSLEDIAQAMLQKNPKHRLPLEMALQALQKVKAREPYPLPPLPKAEPEPTPWCTLL